ncbi:Mariner Mos1 transposase [Eumeta japonica]|uniref:Mariner Mos1 transposase n=1 Tax=Eumeta variegata TaxID=151549 RepID=A0A4C1WM02_EUMVA|nr:Mariner Mos1 transposase [Eumeta japonica]
MLTSEFKEGRPESVVVPQNIDAVQEIIVQHLDVAYRMIKAFLGIKRFEEIRKNNQQHRIILNHDNASCNTSAETTRFLEGHKIELTGHPAYSLDLAPIDFYLFPSVKNKIRGQRLPSREEAVDAFKMHVLEIPQSERKKCYKNWFQHVKKSREERIFRKVFRPVGGERSDFKCFLFHIKTYTERIPLRRLGEAAHCSILRKEIEVSHSQAGYVPMNIESKGLLALHRRADTASRPRRFGSAYSFSGYPDIRIQHRSTSVQDVASFLNSS